MIILANILTFVNKAGVYLNAIFPPRKMALMEISHSRFEQSKNLCYGAFYKVLGDFMGK